MSEPSSKGFVRKRELHVCKSTRCGFAFFTQVTYLDGKVFAGSNGFCPACVREAQARKYERLAAQHRKFAAEWRAKRQRST